MGLWCVSPLRHRTDACSLRSNKRVLYLVTTGAGDPTRASLLLHLAANGSVENEQECALALAGDGAELAVRGTADTVEGVGVPTARELFAKLIGNAIPVYV